MLDFAAGYDPTSGNKTHMGLKQSNIFALYDVHGNVWEWCWDAYVNYAFGSVTDPAGAEPYQDYRVLRGGSWFGIAANCRSASRCFNFPDCKNLLIGFRIAKSNK